MTSFAPVTQLDADRHIVSGQRLAAALRWVDALGTIPAVERGGDPASA